MTDRRQVSSVSGGRDHRYATGDNRYRHLDDSPSNGNSVRGVNRADSRQPRDSRSSVGWQVSRDGRHNGTAYNGHSGSRR